MALTVAGEYLASPAALTDGQTSRIGVTTNHAVRNCAEPNTVGGLSIARLIGSAGANVKAAAGQVYGGCVMNSNAATRYLHLYNKATAATLSTDTPVMTIPLPPSASVCFTTADLGAAFSTGISWAFTTDDIAIPTTAGATTDIHGQFFYK